MNRKLRLEGKKAAVTGASSGIGRASAINLAKAGCDVALIARDVDRLNDTAAEIRKLGRQAVVITADITDGEAVRAAVETAVRELGCIDI
ncbi:MAG: SDR family NAD(P)-dependent oxidoreductase, partial [Oscillospiraceae bacterium]|nr:SDR family NAD(P)-dependent oxidoreductase [Oscillospiraceae bacterium]